MLGIDYQSRFETLVDAIDWDIELPAEWSGYFDEEGQASAYADDERNNQRLKIRVCGALWFERSLPFSPRSDQPVGIYTRDFSRQGSGFLSPLEIYPEEQVRILLPTFWVQLKVVRTRRITSQCYEVGAVLLRQHEPAMTAFEFDKTLPSLAQ